jgi:hypothetical protein
MTQQSRDHLDEATQWLPQNEKDDHGRRICPTCSKAIGPGVAVREGAYIVHLKCLGPTPGT